jgi:hypothetical protein
MTRPKLHIDWLQKNCQKIHYFGLGFIQLKLDDHNRLHFYTNKFEKTVQQEEIHNHRYNFVSTILGGEFYQEIWEVKKLFATTLDGLLRPKHSHWKTQETCSATDKRSFPTFPVNIEKVFSRYYHLNESYYIDHNTFHTVQGYNAITWVKRSDYKKEFADVIFPVGHKPVCPFSNKVAEDSLWEEVERLSNM